MRKIDKGNESLIIKKWMPVIENHLKFKNSNINRLICIYCEWYSSDTLSGGDDLTNILMNIKEKIDTHERIEILGKYLNPASGHIEYKLASGKFIPLKDTDYELPEDELIELFGIEFIRDLDPQKFRDDQLNKLL